MAHQASSEVTSLVAQSDPTGDEAVSNVMLQRRGDVLGPMLAQLAPEEREALKARLGLDRGEPRTDQEVAELMGISPEEARKLADTAEAKLRVLC